MKKADGHMAHAKFLGNVIIHSGLMDPYKGYSFRLTITSNSHLTAKLVKKGTVGSEYTDKPEPSHPPSKKSEYPKSSPLLSPRTNSSF